VDLYDQRARAYAPATGRFLQRDPAGMADGTNLYSYVGNHPIGFGDPMGLDRQELAREADAAVSDKMEATPSYQSIPWYGLASEFALREVAPRAIGAVRAAGGYGLAQAGAGLALVPGAEWAALPLVALGADQLTTGLRQVWSGRPERSNLNAAVARLTGSQSFADHFEAGTLGAAGGASTALSRLVPSVPVAPRPSLAPPGSAGRLTTGVIPRGTTRSTPSASGRILNLGGEGEVPGAINVNRLEANLRSLERILAQGPLVKGDVLQLPFKNNVFSQRIGNRLPYSPEFAEAAAKQAFAAAEPGGVIRVFSSSGGGTVWLDSLKRAGFRDVRVERGYAVGVKPE